MTAGRPTYDVGMRASAVPSLSDRPVAATAARLPRPVVWLLWLLAALAGSVVLGFLAGLARPREPDPWASVQPPGTQCALNSQPAVQVNAKAIASDQIRQFTSRGKAHPM